MACIRKELLLDARPEDVWSAVRDFGAPHEKLVPGVLVDSRLEPGAQSILKHAACIGHRFNSAILAGVTESNHASVARGLLPSGTVGDAVGSALEQLLGGKRRGGR